MNDRLRTVTPVINTREIRVHIDIHNGRRFLRRTAPDQQDVELSEVVTTIRAFISPMLIEIIAGEPLEKQ